MNDYTAPTRETIDRIVRDQDREAAEEICGNDHGAPFSKKQAEDIGPDYICAAMDGAILAWGADQAGGNRDLVIYEKDRDDVIRLNTSTTTDKDLSGFNFYVDAGEFFDVDDYCEAYGISKYDIDGEDIKNAQDKAARLTPPESMLVSHES